MKPVEDEYYALMDAGDYGERYDELDELLYTKGEDLDGD